MDVSGQPSSLKGPPIQNPPSARDPSRYPIQVSKLRPEELKMYKDCSGSMYYMAGVPFAVFCHFLSQSFFQPAKVEPAPQRYIRRGFIFLGNMLLGTFLLGGPYCYRKLLKMHQELEKQTKDSDAELPSVIEGVQPVTQAEDFSYPTDLVGSFNEPESNYSSDFNFTKILTDDEEKLKTPPTTYQELRMKHRSGQSTSPTRGQFPSVSEPDPRLSGLSAPIEEPIARELPQPRKVVKRNKYGDEIE